MTKRDFDDIIKGLRDNVETLASLTVRRYKKDAVRDGRKMITSMKKDLHRWTDLLDEQRLTTEDFEWLINAQAASIRMSSLEKSGLTMVRVDHFRKSIFNMVIDSVFEAVLPEEENHPV